MGVVKDVSGLSLAMSVLPVFFVVGALTILAARIWFLKRDLVR
jgi:hypothetical protein